MERDREKEERKFGCCWLLVEEEVVEPWFDISLLLLIRLFELRPSSPVLPTLLRAPTTSLTNVSLLVVATGWIVRSRAGAWRTPPSFSRQRPPVALEREWRPPPEVWVDLFTSICWGFDSVFARPSGC